METIDNIIVQGRDVTVTRRKGLATYYRNGELFQTESVTELDFGSHGTAKVFTIKPDREPTQEERDAVRRGIDEAVRSVMVNQGYW